MQGTIALTGNRLDVLFLMDFFKRHSYNNIVKVKKSDLKQILHSDILHIISIKSNGVAGIIWIIVFFVLRVLRKKIWLHWQGTDVLELSSPYVFFLRKLVTKHTAQAPWLVDELKEKNLCSEWVAITSPPSKYELTPLPDKFTVLTYMGTAIEKNQIYNPELILRLIRHFTDVKFLVVGDVKKEFFSSANVKCLGLIDYSYMDYVHNQTSVLLRITTHDGLSFMVLEALSRGRHVIWNKNFPFCHYAVEYDDVVSTLEKLMSAIALNEEGVRFVKEQFNEDKCVRTIIDIYRELLS